MENRSRMLGVLAGRDMDSELLAKWVASADWVLAADSGANHLAEIGAKPDVVIGDMDSVSSHAMCAAGEAIVERSQERTDCDKLLSYASSQGAKAITLICVEGDLPDHVIATLNSVARSPLDVTLAYRRGLGHIVRPHRPFRQEIAEGRRVSLLALDRCEAVSLRCVVWPLENALLEPTGLASISNRSAGGHVEAVVGSGAAFLFVERPAEEVPMWL